MLHILNTVLSAFLSMFLTVCQSVYFPDCVFVCWSMSLTLCMFVYVHDGLPGLSTSLTACLSIYLSPWLSACPWACLHVFLRAVYIVYFFYWMWEGFRMVLSADKLKIPSPLSLRSTIVRLAQIEDCRLQVVSEQLFWSSQKFDCQVQKCPSELHQGLQLNTLNGVSVYPYFSWLEPYGVTRLFG